MNPYLSHLGIPVARSRRVPIGHLVFLGEAGITAHPADFEKLLDRGIDDWEAVRRAAMRTFDERWRKAMRKWEGEP